MATSKRDRKWRRRQSKASEAVLPFYLSSLSLSQISVCLLFLGRERNAVVSLRLSIFGDDRDDFASGLVAAGGVDTDRRAIPDGRDTTLIQQINVAGELRPGVFFRLSGQERQQV